MSGRVRGWGRYDGNDGDGYKPATRDRAIVIAPNESSTLHARGRRPRQPRARQPGEGGSRRQPRQLREPPAATARFLSLSLVLSHARALAAGADAAAGALPSQVANDASQVVDGSAASRSSSFTDGLRARLRRAAASCCSARIHVASMIAISSAVNSSIVGQRGSANRLTGLVRHHLAGLVRHLSM